MQGNVLRIRGNIYYGSLPVIEKVYHQALARGENLVIDFSQAYYIDPEGLRWLAAARATGKATFVDRRSGRDRRSGQPVTAAIAKQRRATRDRRQKSDLI